MRKAPWFGLLSILAAVALSGCSTLASNEARIAQKAKEYYYSGEARDMADARRMAEAFYSPDKTNSSRAARTGLDSNSGRLSELQASQRALDSWAAARSAPEVPSAP